MLFMRKLKKFDRVDYISISTLGRGIGRRCDAGQYGERKGSLFAGGICIKAQKVGVARGSAGPMAAKRCGRQNRIV